jgi:hypothetical protein
MAVSRTERRRTVDWIEYDVIDDAKNVWIERDDLADGKVVGTVRLTEPRPEGAPAPKPRTADKPTNPFVVRVPAGVRFSFGHQAEKALYRGLILGGLAAGTAIGILNLIGQAVF